MKTFLYKLQVLIFCIFLLLNISYSQPHNETARLTIRGGHSVPFIFSTFDHYEDGIVREDWTQIEIYYIDTTDAGVANATTTWKLAAKAETPNIVGISGNISLDYLYIAAECIDCGGDAGYATNGTYRLTAVDQELIIEGGMTDRNVEVSYYCGMPDQASFTVFPDNTAGPYNTVFGEPADYYSVDILFTLELDDY